MIMTETAPESTNSKGCFSQVLRLANLPRVVFRGDPPEDAFDKIARRLYPDDRGKIFTFIVHMTYAVYSSWCYPFNLPDVNLALEGSDVDVLRWLRAHIDYDCGNFFLETPQEKLQRVMKEGNDENTELQQDQQSDSSGASLSDCVHVRMDTGHIGAENSMELQQQQRSELRRRR